MPRFLLLVCAGALASACATGAAHSRTPTQNASAQAEGPTSDFSDGSIAPGESGAPGAKAPSKAVGGSAAAGTEVPYEVNDVHFHLTNYVQEGPDIHAFLKMMGTTVNRCALFGIPLQQQWSYRVTGSQAPTYYLQSDAHLYYYSFTDALIATTYLSLSKEDQARFDPMITGFNPTDMYAADHIRRVLQTFPGVFTGIGEFTVHKEFVSDKIAGDVASLSDPALDRVLDFAAESGLVVLLHNDMDVPFPKEGQPPAYLEQMRALLERHPKTTIIWAHMGVGRVVRPVANHLGRVEQMLSDPKLKNLYFDISWTEVAKYVNASDASLKRTAELLNRYPERFLFGTDALAPKDASSYLETYELYRPLWALLNDRARALVLRGNYERLFDQARTRVRAWEKAHPAVAHAARPRPSGLRAATGP